MVLRQVEEAARGHRRPARVRRVVVPEVFASCMKFARQLTLGRAEIELQLQRVGGIRADH